MVEKNTFSANAAVGHKIVEQNYNLIYTTSLSTAKEYFKSKGPEWADKFHAEECVDRVFDYILGSGDKFDPTKSSLKSYVKMKTTNICAEYFRGYKHFENIEMEAPDGETFERAECSTSITPFEDVVRWEKDSLIRDYLDTKSELDGEVFELYLKGYQPKEIGQMLSLTAEAVALRVFKMKKALKDLGIAA